MQEIYSLLKLNEGENFLREKSLETIEKNYEIKIHAKTIEAVLHLIEYFSYHYEFENEDTETIQLLGIRIFNNSTSAFCLILRGYYQPAAILIRDLIETNFLLSYFKSNIKDISEWRNCDEKTRKKKYKPIKVRTYLDERDGFKEKKREEHYNLFCELASHPTPTSFRMLIPYGTDRAHCGAYFDEFTLLATMSEMSKTLLLIGEVFPNFFEWKYSSDYRILSNFLKEKNEWIKKFFKIEPDERLLFRLLDLEKRAELKGLQIRPKAS